TRGHHVSHLQPGRPRRAQAERARRMIKIGQLSMTVRSFIGSSGVVCALALFAAPAAAQIPVVQPDGSLANPAAPPPPPEGSEGAGAGAAAGTGTGTGGGPVVISIGPDGKPIVNPEKPEGEAGATYFRDDNGGGLLDEGTPRQHYQIGQNGGPVPETH